MGMAEDQKVQGIPESKQLQNSTYKKITCWIFNSQQIQPICLIYHDLWRSMVRLRTPLVSELKNLRRCKTTAAIFMKQINGNRSLEALRITDQALHDPFSTNSFVI